ncbi:unnamed protein product [Tuber aestivum]|uniref:Biogenesis of lysosome-related organelles complex 1 subunit CNL1 n=1 Tax=Tuber aestivum TaxID=59557 RepID=A0A292PNY6_9PEZI|nr:unnamed protein product [Tuber aestivum]
MDPPTDHTLHISREDLNYLTATQRRLHHHGHQHPSTPSSSSTTNTANSGGSLNLDPQALAALSNHFDALLAAITNRVETLSTQTVRSTQASHRRAGGVVEAATVEIETLKDVLRQCDELQNEFLKIRRIGEIVKGFRARVDALERRIGK